MMPLIIILIVSIVAAVALLKHRKGNHLFNFIETRQEKVNDGFTLNPFDVACVLIDNLVIYA